MYSYGPIGLIYISFGYGEIADYLVCISLDYLFCISLSAGNLQNEYLEAIINASMMRLG